MKRDSRVNEGGGRGSQPSGRTATEKDRDATQTPPTPRVMTLGLVRRGEIPLSWLDPAAAFSCVGLYVPRSTRNKPLETDRHPASDGSVGGACPSGEGVPNPAYSLNRLSSATGSVDVRACSSRRQHSTDNPPTPLSNLPASPPPSRQSHQRRSLSRSPQLHLMRQPVIPPARLSGTVSDGLDRGTSRLCNPRPSPRHICSKNIRKLKMRTKSAPVNQSAICSHPSPPPPSPPPPPPLDTTPPLTPPLLRSPTLFLSKSPISDPLLNSFLLHSSSVSDTRPFPHTSSQSQSLKPCVEQTALQSPTSGLSSFPDLKLRQRTEPTNGGSDPEISDYVDVKRSCPASDGDRGSLALLPSGSLALSGHFHSKTYQGLCLWLAKNGFLLVSACLYPSGSHLLGPVI